MSEKELNKNYIKGIISASNGNEELLLNELVELYSKQYTKGLEQGKLDATMGLINYLEDKINICDGYIDTTKSDLEELKYTLFAHDELKKEVDENIKARNIYQDILERVRSGKYE